MYMYIYDILAANGINFCLHFNNYYCIKSSHKLFKPSHNNACCSLNVSLPHVQEIDTACYIMSDSVGVMYNELINLLCIK